MKLTLLAGGLAVAAAGLAVAYARQPTRPPAPAPTPVPDVPHTRAPQSGQVPQAPSDQGQRPPTGPDRPPPRRGEIRVEFGDPSVRIETGFEVSNVVAEYDDGTRQRFEGLSGHRVEVRGTGRHAGKAIARVWVKAGPNLSGDGPGYGTRFDRPPAKP